MRTDVLHQPRIAFDAATVLTDVSTADEALFSGYRDRLAELLGPSYLEDLLATRAGLLAPGGAERCNVEAGRWRVRFEDALRTRSGLAEGLRELTRATRGRLG
ncbi:hypothetical protein [Catellatospora tritici]|uniref:hypothetical protein n=1 Tax=Catellatospora tritici TaxID=2851566 RepID=UPI001C2DBAA3|nr:hypothetical protein [Catellatospora tritici]MBV1856223.1 hypothetical protein [Catellatospora tritici]